MTVLQHPFDLNENRDWTTRKLLLFLMDRPVHLGCESCMRYLFMGCGGRQSRECLYCGD